MDTWDTLKPRLAASPFRSRFKLGSKELHRLAERGFDATQAECKKILTVRLAPAFPGNDGKQTPFHGHACFIAQHATGCCCRSCLEKWHGIPRGRALTDQEINDLTEILLCWIREKAGELNRIAHTPDLF